MRDWKCCNLCVFFGKISRCKKKGLCKKFDKYHVWLSSLDKSLDQSIDISSMPTLFILITLLNCFHTDHHKYLYHLIFYPLPLSISFTRFNPDHNRHPFDLSAWMSSRFLLPRYRDCSPVHLWTSPLFPRLFLSAGKDCYSYSLPLVFLNSLTTCIQSFYILRVVFL